MRIWILNHYASPPDRPAGTRHYEFGRLLAGWGHDVTIFASSLPPNIPDSSHCQTD